MEDRSRSAAMNEGGSDRVRRNMSVAVDARLDRGRYVLKALRGDFEGVTTVSGEGVAAGAARALETTGT